MADYDDILIALRRITRAIDLHSKKLVRTSGLTAPQLLVLQSVRRHGCVKPSTIARDIVLSQATVTSIVDRLEKNGLVTRQRSAKDRRVVEILLTEGGQKKLLAAPELLQAGFLREYRKLDEWERTQLTASLQRVAAMMDAEDIDAAPILEVGDIEHKTA
ncbi:MarR family winged helix-turn-helix transcriptional regulator [Eilatimonas milleporae]|uniref:MarR family transcriptional regulator n=1 Tax=Eilatimonas milleporae TaxID=911205 RepID=A0A3M0BZ39_9PROT|nr:MarR family transcriptional regulator [Eilatimonas milleporae]RMB02874.1 MarR family transcriptional regulator [Eilatimonas milleporae]